MIGKTIFFLFSVTALTSEGFSHPIYNRSLSRDAEVEAARRRQEEERMERQREEERRQREEERRQREEQRRAQEAEAAQRSAAQREEGRQRHPTA